MRLDDMIGLEKGLDRQLPVARQPLGNVETYVAVLELPRRDMRGGLGPKIVGKRGGVWIHVDKYEPAEHLDPGLRQREFRTIDMGKIPFAHDSPVGTVYVPAPAVKAAAELARATIGA